MAILPFELGIVPGRRGLREAKCDGGVRCGNAPVYAGERK